MSYALAVRITIKTAETEASPSRQVTCQRDLNANTIHFVNVDGSGRRLMFDDDDIVYTFASASAAGDHVTLRCWSRDEADRLVQLARGRGEKGRSLMVETKWD